jgi:hypothetical protein
MQPQTTFAVKGPPTVDLVDLVREIAPLQQPPHMRAKLH